MDPSKAVGNVEVPESSPGNETKDTTTDSITNDESSPNDDTDNGNEEWESIVNIIRHEEPSNSVSRQSLDLFEQGLARRSLANERLEEIFTKTEQKLQTLVSSLTSTVLPLFQAMQARLEHQEEELVQTLLQNHHNRQEMVEHLQQSRHIYHHKFEVCMANILKQPLPTESPKGAILENHDDCKDQDTNQDGTDSKEDSQDEENIDWTVLAEFSPESVEAFLQGREKWHEAHNRLVQTLETVEQALQDDMQKLLTLMQQAHDIVEEPLDSLQEDVQMHLHHNVLARQEMQVALQESAQQAQGIFASLMARVSSCLPTKRDSPTDDTTTKESAKVARQS